MTCVPFFVLVRVFILSIEISVEVVNRTNLKVGNFVVRTFVRKVTSIILLLILDLNCGFNPI